MQDWIARNIRIALPVVCLAALLAAVFVMQPRAMSYMGLNLLLNLALPIAFATIAQMFVIAVNELDLSIGAYVGFVACVGATFLRDEPALGVLIIAGGIAVYAGLGALIASRNLPSIVVTLGMSFVWLGLAILVLPTPGGKAPDWLRALMTLRTPLLPFAIYAAALLALAVHLGLMRSAYGAVLRGAGGNPRSVERAGWSLRSITALMFALARQFGASFEQIAHRLTTSGDANIALRYTLLSVAGVILGGGEFTGGRVSPVGAVVGAMTLTLAASFLSFLRLDPDWQIGAQGVILILVLALRVLINRTEGSAA